jgi:arylsulfatase A
MRFLTPLVLLVLLTLSGCSSTEEATQTAPPPNIVFIMADDLGYGHLGSYGGDKIETPHVDRLAADGMRFTQAYAGSTVCAPSRSVLMTGLHGGNTPIRRNGGGASLQPDDVTMAEVLKQAGYATGGFGKWGLGVEGSPGHPLEQGFDEFVGYLNQVHGHFYYPFWLTDGHGQLMLPENEGRMRERYAHDEIVGRAMDFIRTNKDQPFFCYLPVTIPHVELAVPAESLQQYIGRWEETPGFQEPRPGYIVSKTPKATYAAMVSHLDRDVGRIVDLLAELGIADNTVVIFTSDNGAQSRYDVQEEFFQASGPLRGYKGSMYEGGLRVPLVVKWPGKVAPGTVSELPTYFPDWMPTLAQITGAQPPTTDGHSILPTLLSEGEQPRHEWLYWELVDQDGAPNRRGARTADWKFVHPNADSPVELYDLTTDLGEQTDVAADHPQIIASFENWFQTNRTPSRTWQNTAPVTIDDYVK